MTYLDRTPCSSQRSHGSIHAPLEHRDVHTQSTGVSTFPKAQIREDGYSQTMYSSFQV